MTPEIATDLFFRGAFFLLLLTFTVNGAILGYHWFTYGTAQKTAMVAMVAYIIGGILCFLVMLPALV